MLVDETITLPVAAGDALKSCSAGSRSLPPRCPGSTRTRSSTSRAGWCATASSCPSEPPADRAPHPRETLDRCALRAQLRGDPMLGTAFPAARLLLVEQPGPWGGAGCARRGSACPRRTSSRRRRRAHGVRVQAVRRPGRTPPATPPAWALVDTRDETQSLRRGEFDDPARAARLPLDGAPGTPDDEPLYLVCAHSKHDTCCALRGRPVAAALAALRPGRVWETSHLGGDRFAANVLVLPSGLLYGRVLPFAAAEFVAAAESGEVIGALLRGRIGLPAAAQAALAFAHEQLALRHRRDLSVVSTSPVADGAATVRLRGPHGEFDVTVPVERVAAAGLTCHNARANAFLAYRPLAISRVEY